MTTIDWIRHGQTYANTQGVIQGQLDTAMTWLTPTGERQAQRRHQQLDLTPYDRVLVSPLHRAQQTATWLTADYAGPVTTDPRLMEAAYETAALLAQFPTAFDPLTREVRPKVLPRIGGESYLQVQRRLGQVIAELVVDHPHEHVLVVSHGLTIKNAALLMLAAPATLALPEPTNLSLTRTTVDPVTGHRYLNSYSEPV